MNVKSIPLKLIDPPSQADRFNVDLASVQDLAASMAIHGQLQPIGLIPRDDRYEISYGHRRYLAAKSLFWDTIDAAILEDNQTETEVLRLVENNQREQLAPLEEAVAVARLREKFGYTQEQTAEALKRGVAWVRKREALLRLPDDLMEAVNAEKINPSVALELARIEDDMTREIYLNQAIIYGASQAVASHWVNSYQTQGTPASAQSLIDQAEDYKEAARQAGTYCHCCTQHRTFANLTNVFLCAECYDATHQAARSAASARTPQPSVASGQPPEIV